MNAFLTAIKHHPLLTYFIFADVFSWAMVVLISTSFKFAMLALFGTPLADSAACWPNSIFQRLPPCPGNFAKRRPSQSICSREYGPIGVMHGPSRPAFSGN